MGQEDADVNTTVAEIKDRDIKDQDYTCLNIWGKPGGL